MTTKTEPALFCRRSAAGFTLLELIIAVTLLAAFVLPMLQLITEARVRAIRYTNKRQLRDLAQQKLHDRIHYIEELDEGTFEEDGRPNWEWLVDEPVVHSEGGGQVILEYRITVTLPQKVDDSQESRHGELSTYEYSVWALPNERWMEEQSELQARGLYSPLYGYADGSYPDGSGGMGLPSGY